MSRRKHRIRTELACLTAAMDDPDAEYLATHSLDRRIARARRDMGEDRW